MNDRRFGVELEFHSGGIKNEGVGNALVDAGLQHWVGEKIEREAWHGSFVYYDKIGSDGSEIELRSPILCGKNGLKELYKVVRTLNEVGCYTTDFDGLHVHHDAPEFVDNEKLVLKLLKSWVNNQEQISKFIEPKRAEKTNHGPCAHLTQDGIDSFEYSLNNGARLSNAIAGNLPRGNLNVHSLVEHGTVEFRYHEGTLDWDEIESWINFGQDFLNGVLKRKNPVNETESPVVLLNRLKARKNTREALINKAISFRTLEAVNA